MAAHHVDPTDSFGRFLKPEREAYIYENNHADNKKKLKICEWSYKFLGVSFEDDNNTHIV